MKPPGNSLEGLRLGLSGLVTRAWIRALVGEIRSHELHSMARRKRLKKRSVYTSGKSIDGKQISDWGVCT